MSDYVTWERCPRCGLLAAVGWAPVVATGAAPPGPRPVEFDCRAGCQISGDELVEHYGPPLRRTPA
jgi:hypothetical protein